MAVPVLLTMLFAEFERPRLVSLRGGDARLAASGLAAHHAGRRIVQPRLRGALLGALQRSVGPEAPVPVAEHESGLRRRAADAGDPRVRRGARPRLDARDPVLLARADRADRLRARPLHAGLSHPVRFSAGRERVPPARRRDVHDRGRDRDPRRLPGASRCQRQRVARALTRGDRARPDRRVVRGRDRRGACGPAMSTMPPCRWRRPLRGWRPAPWRFLRCASCPRAPRSSAC